MTTVVFMLAAGCASDEANRYYGPFKYSARPVNSVEILSAAPPRPYVVLADFQSRGESPRDMQRKAAAIGADAVVVVTVGGYRAKSDAWAGEDSQHQSYSRILGTAILYKEAEGADAAAGKGTDAKEPARPGTLLPGTPRKEPSR